MMYVDICTLTVLGSKITSEKTKVSRVTWSSVLPEEELGNSTC